MARANPELNAKIIQVITDLLINVKRVLLLYIGATPNKLREMSEDVLVGTAVGILNAIDPAIDQVDVLRIQAERKDDKQDLLEIENKLKGFKNYYLTIVKTRNLPEEFTGLDDENIIKE
jgi:hypothetical protein